MPHLAGKKSFTNFAGMKSHAFSIALLFSLSFSNKTLIAQSYDEKITTVPNFEMTINNLGMIGNAFKGSYSALGYSSCEYPKGSGVEHLFEGGLWIGAKVNGSVVVTTACIDDASGYTTGKEGFEFTANIGSTLQERSTLLDNPAYSSLAISHQDFVCDFTDKNTIVPGTSIPLTNIENGPLNADVHFESYTWNYPYANYFIILNYTIQNNSNNTWQDAYLGFWIDPVVRNVNITPAGSGGSNFYNKSGTGYIDSLFIGYEFDATGDIGFTNSYIGLKFLGAEFNGQFFHTQLDTSFKTFFNSWTFKDFSSSYRTPANDNERYEKLSSGLNYSSQWATYQNQLRTPGNRSQMTSVGPFPSIAPGQSVNVVFAVVLAKQYDDGQPQSTDSPLQKQNLIKNAKWAQAAYNGEDQNFNGILDPNEDIDNNGRITRFILPAPPNTPKTRYVVENQKVTIYWADNAEASTDPISRKKDFEGYRIYKTQVGFDLTNTQDVADALNLVASFDKPNNGIGFDNGFQSILLNEPMFFEGDTTAYRYRYSFENLLNGWQHAFAVTAYDEGEPQDGLESLETSTLTTLKRIFPGMPANQGFKQGEPFVYPNPYYGNAAWEGSAVLEENRKIYFANLPPRCEVRVYNTAMDLVYSFKHEQNYSGEDTPWFSTYADTKQNLFAGGEHAWNLLSTDNQIIARGLYFFAVKDLDTGEVRKGKFVIIR